MTPRSGAEPAPAEVPRSETAFAKINLALHVRRRRDDGYHEIETIFAFAEDGDRLWARTDGAPFTLSGRFAAGLSSEADDDNLVMRAARGLAAMKGHDAIPPLHLEKQLPVAAGIGGGSADAAAALRLLCPRFNLASADPRIADLARALGADVPACLASVTVRGDGRGDDLRPVEANLLSGMPLLLVNPGVPLATGPVFGAWDGIDRGPLASGNPLQAALAGRNDLETPARTLCPVIGAVVALLSSQPGVLLARMSGSGATCFALFERPEARDAASYAIAATHPGWWQLASRLR